MQRRDRSFFLALDHAGLGRCVAELKSEAAAAALSERGEALAIAEAAALWLLLARSEAFLDVEARAKALYKEVSAQKLVLLSVESVALQAMAALGAGDVESALSAARRASRMARTEAVPEAECIANLVLGRVRRHAGKPHLASRILTALGHLAPPVWHPLIAWELLLAGGLEAGAALARMPSPVPTPAQNAALALTDALEAARDGRRVDFDAAAARLLGHVATWPSLAQEASILLAAVDLTRVPPPALVAWTQALSTVLPLGLHGATPTAPEQAIAFVVVYPGAAGRRILNGGLALAAPGATSPEQLSGSPREHYRTDTALAVLAAAGVGGLLRDDLFHAIYGLAYSPALHEGAFRVLVHRMRKRVEGLAEVLREGDRLSLRVDSPLIVPDPRCARPTEDVVLRLLAARGAFGSDEIASELRLSVRATQSALKQLVEDGALQVERQGRQIQYRVVDTTFCEPTPFLTSIDDIK